jgi:two-component system, NtrC family, response regulator AtoC
VRELENVIERASILANKKTILINHLPADITLHINNDALRANIHAPSGASFSLPVKIAQIEKQFILQALDATQGNKAKAAKLLEISERSLWNKLETYQLK